MPKTNFLTRKRDKQRFPVKRRVVRKDSKLKKRITPTFAVVNSDDEYRRVLQEKDRFLRKLNFAAFLSDRLHGIGVDSILVGGSAIEVYTDGDFPTVDMDFEVTDLTKAVRLLTKLGFKKQDGIWFNSDLSIAVDVSSKGYTGDPDKVREIKVRNYTVKVAGVEDLVVNRLYSAKFWKSNPQRDIEEATALLTIFKGKLDNDYLDIIAKKNGVTDFLANVRQRALAQ